MRIYYEWFALKLSVLLLLALLPVPIWIRVLAIFSSFLVYRHVVAFFLGLQVMPYSDLTMWIGSGGNEAICINVGCYEGDSDPEVIRD